MKKITFLLFCLLACLQVAQAQDKPKKKNKRIKTNKNMISISPLQGSVTLKVGQTATFAYKVHASVGVAGETEIKDETIAKIQKKELKFDNEENAKMPGGDSATETIFIEALKKGETTLTYRDVFRGKVEQTSEIKITVE
jgi:hypothetical protein